MIKTIYQCDHCGKEGTDQNNFYFGLYKERVLCKECTDKYSDMCEKWKKRQKEFFHENEH